MKKVRKSPFTEIVNDEKTFEENFNKEENSYMFGKILEHLAKC